jgi:hypothetical protein
MGRGRRCVASVGRVGASPSILAGKIIFRTKSGKGSFNANYFGLKGLCHEVFDFFFYKLAKIFAPEGCVPQSTTQIFTLIAGITDTGDITFRCEYLREISFKNRNDLIGILRGLGVTDS